MSSKGSDSEPQGDNLASTTTSIQPQQTASSEGEMEHGQREPITSYRHDAVQTGSAGERTPPISISKKPEWHGVGYASEMNDVMNRVKATSEQEVLRYIEDEPLQYALEAGSESVGNE